MGIRRVVTQGSAARDREFPTTSGPALEDCGLSEECPILATGCESSSGGIRTPDTRIMIPLKSGQNPDKNETFENDAAAGAAVGNEPDDLTMLAAAWPHLSADLKTGILAMVKASHPNGRSKP